MSSLPDSRGCSVFSRTWVYRFSQAQFRGLSERMYKMQHNIDKVKTQVHVLYALLRAA